jgi:hypothetical protein
MEVIAQTLNTLTKIHLDRDRAYRKRFKQLTDLLQMDAENIRTLAHIAEIHEQRLDRLEGE